jgi:hypothetical protein
VIVAMVVGSLVLTGVAALTIDVGSILAERRVVQNGADAASLELAQACARADASRCSPSSSDLTDLANLNSPDGFTDIASVCGTVTPFASCGTQPANPTLVQCTKLPSLLPATANWVEVRTTTRSTTASPSVVSRYFANLFDPSYNGIAVKACARAAWGPAGGLTTVVPVAFSMCEWHSGTANGTTYGNEPPFTAANPETPGLEVAIKLNDSNDAACATWAGHDLPGGFGWLCHDSSCSPPAPATCSVAVDGNGWVDIVTGIGGGNDCKPQMNAMVGTVVDLPIFDCMSKTKTFCNNTATGTGSFYHVKGYAAFFVTGVDVTGGMSNNFLPASIWQPTGYPTVAAKATCTSKGGKCIYGWFLKDFLPASAVIGGGSSSFGLTAVQAAG